MTVLLSLTLLLLSLGQIGRMSFVGQEVNFYWYEIIVGLTCLFLFAKNFKSGFRIVKKSFPSVFLFGGALLISIFLNLRTFSIFEIGVATLYYFRLIVYLFFFTLMIAEFKSKSDLKNIFPKLFLGFTLLTVIFGFGQYFLYPDLRNLIYLGWDPHLYRVFGTFFDTAVAGSVYGLLLTIIFFEKKRFTGGKFWYLLIGLLTLLCLLSYSRGLYIGLIITFGLFFVKNKMWKVIGLSVILFAVVIIFLPKPFGEGVKLLRTSTVESRLTDGEQAVTLWLKKPIFGFGYNTIRYAKEKDGLLNAEDRSTTHAGASYHSSYLIILVSSGVAGLAAFIFFIYQLARSDKNLAYLTILLCVLSLFDNIFLHPFILVLYFLYGSYRLSYRYGR